MLTRELLPKANPVSQMAACRNTLSSLLIVESQRFSSEQKRSIEQTVFFITACLQSSACNNDKDLANKIVKTTVNGILNTFVIDEMHRSKEKRIGERMYGRFGWLLEENVSPASAFDFPDQPLVTLPLEVSRTHYTRRQEMYADFDNFKKDVSLQPLPTLHAFLQMERNRSGIYYFTFPLPAEEMSQVMAVLANNVTVLMPFHMNALLGGYALAGEKAVEIENRFFLPQSEPALQEILEAILESGVPVIKTDQSDSISLQNGVLTKKEASAQLQNIWNALIAQASLTDPAQRITLKQGKLYALSSTEETVSISEDLGSMLIEQYKKIFIETPEDAFSSANLFQIFLTRTGLSATTVGIYTAAEYFGGTKSTRPLGYVYPGFYYESEEVVRKEFIIANDPNDSNIRVYCINVSPNPPYISNKNNPDYELKRDELIAHIVQKARTDPDNDYFLIMDITTNLLYKTPPSHTTVPQNLSLFETASLTKYRRGDKNHFSGIVIYTGKEKIKKYIGRGLEYAHGTISTRDTFFFQSMTKREVEEGFKEYRRKSDMFSDAFSHVIKQLPKDLQWRVESHIDSPQYIFLIPPMDAVLTAAKRKYATHTFYLSNISEYGLRGIDTSYKQFFDDIVFSLVPLFQSTAGFEKGSGFGLNTTRLTFIPGNFSYQGDLFEQELPRISFGLKTSLPALKKFGEKLAEEVIQVTENTIAYNSP